MSERKDSSRGRVRGLLWLVVLAMIIYVVVRNFGVFGNVLRVLLGFGAVILVHEFGHFVIGKISGIKVEAFSMFMPPILIGVRKTEKGFRIRILPELLPKENDESGDGLLCFTVGPSGRAWDTEYRIGLIPFGGFVKFLGQDDVGPVKKCDDPRSFANKPALARMAVIAGGVVFNAISAVIIFMVIFLVGIELPPPVIGGIQPGSPAEVAGLKPGDEVIEIAGKRTGLDYSDIGLAAALSGDREAVPLTVRHADGSTEDFKIVPEETLTATGKMRLFGVLQPQTLTIAEVSDPNKLREATGFAPGDRITAVNETEVRTHWDMVNALEGLLEPSVKFTAERTEGLQKSVVVKSDIPLDWMVAASYDIESESELYHVATMVPRLRVTHVSRMNGGSAELSVAGRIFAGLRGLFGLGPAEQPELETEPTLKPGDIIVGIGDLHNPTYTEMRQVTQEYENRTLSMTVLRTDANGVQETVTTEVRPRRPAGSDRALIGIGVALDADHAVVAGTVKTDAGSQKLDIPRGSLITAVDGEPVSDFYDVVRIIRRNAGQRISLDYRLDENVAGSAAIDMTAGSRAISVESELAEVLWFTSLTRVYKANGPVDAIAMGYSETLGFITQTYVTFRRLASGLVSPKALMGPVGIMTLSYRIAKEEPLIKYIYFLGLISAVIAVFNFLPLPPLDGGLAVLLLVEKIKGSAVSERVQAIVIYVGWALIGTLILYVTFNDIVRSFFS